jgi:hypothetical protein
MPVEQSLHNYAKISGYLEGTIRGQLSNIECTRSCGLMSDKQLLDEVVARLKLALDTVKNGIE